MIISVSFSIESDQIGLKTVEKNLSDGNFFSSNNFKIAQVSTTCVHHNKCVHQDIALILDGVFFVGYQPSCISPVM